VGAGEADDMSDLLDFFADNTSLLLDKTLEHMGIAALAIVIALAIALPIGIVLGHQHRGSTSRSTSPTSCARCPASP
jgi:ABC-type proline/glycine betaine transport system permease subunit